MLPGNKPLTHWGWVTHICVGKLTIIGSDNGLSPRRRQAIIWTSAGILLIRPLGTNFSEILIRNQTFSFKKMHLKMSSAKWRPFYLGLNVLTKPMLLYHHVATVSSLGHNELTQWGLNKMVPHIMACCLMAPSHYPDQCWLTTVLGYSFENSFTWSDHIFSP